MDHGMREATVAIADEEMLAAIQERQRDARYPMLLAIAPHRYGVVYHRVREGTGLVSVAIRHDALTPDQHAALGEFRLHQYLLWRWYDSAVISKLGARADPAFDTLPAATIHMLVGTSEGRILAYFAMQPAVDHCRPAGALNTVGRATSKQHCHLSDCPRPLFPAEFESFGPDVFASLPALSPVPVDCIRELTCLLRNFAVPSPLTVVAVVEAVFTAWNVVTHPAQGIEAVLGCMDVEARRVLADLQVPLLYAANAPVIHNQLAFYWLPEMNEPGKFWPFVLATQDLRARSALHARINEVLSSTSHKMRRELLLLRKQTIVSRPPVLLPEPGSCPVLWTADPLHPAAEPEHEHKYRDNVPAPGETGEQDRDASKIRVLPAHPAGTSDSR
jgi:hypothetical protein